ncbi:MAG TPA: sugar ABC transporter permease [Nocardioidaceae bacterium]|nr:sugar ABC transporter permease [Nocardioidaceae bacterium]
MNQVPTTEPDTSRADEPDEMASQPGQQKQSLEERDAAEKKKAGVKLIIGTIGLLITLAVIGTIFQALALYGDDIPRLLQGLIAVAAGVGGAGALFYFLNMLVEGLPKRLSGGVIPYAFLLPAVLLIGVMLIYPTVQTIHYSFADADSEAYVGFQNYVDVFSDPDFRESLFNNLLWLIVVPAITVVIGVIVAVLADKLSTTGEKISKSFIFVPMAISFVGAAAIWTLIWQYDPPGDNQTGLLNALWTGLGDLIGAALTPVAWLSVSTLSLNDFILMAVVVWLQAGFAMILLSSAIKGVPEETIEAARIDGANEWQIFRQVVIPQIRGTMITVYITVLILVLKIFDIIYVTTNGRDGTNVIANLFFQEIFRTGDNGVASAIVVILLIAVTPVLVYQVRHFRREETER